MKLEIRLHAHQGGISSSILSVFFTDKFYKLLKSLHLIAESKFVSENHWQNAWWNAPQVGMNTRSGTELIFTFIWLAHAFGTWLDCARSLISGLRRRRSDFKRLLMLWSHLHVKPSRYRAICDFSRNEEDVAISWQLRGLRGNCGACVAVAGCTCTRMYGAYWMGTTWTPLTATIHGGIRELRHGRHSRFSGTLLYVNNVHFFTMLNRAS